MVEVEQGEEIKMIVRRHWFVLVGDLFILVFMVALPGLVLFGNEFVHIDRLVGFDGAPFYSALFFLFVWLTIIWMIGWYMWMSYYLDVLIITDRRIFDIEQDGFFKRRSGSFRIDRIQDISVDVRGVIQTMLDFGTITIETAGERENFEAAYIAKPYDVKKFISTLQDTVAGIPRPVVMHDAAGTTAKEMERGQTLITGDDSGV